MTFNNTHIIRKILLTIFILSIILILSILFGISFGSTGHSLHDIISVILHRQDSNPMISTIVWDIRFPRVILSILTGGALALGGLVFQAILRNPLAEPYILGISGGSAIGAIIGILTGLSGFPGINITSFTGGILTLFIILLLTPYYSYERNNTLLLSGVMINALFAAVIMFLISTIQDSRLHTILFWLMGDLSNTTMSQTFFLFFILLPCFIVIFMLSRHMNLLLMGEETAQTMGTPVKKIIIILLIVTSLMISSTVCNAGLIGFVGLVIPHVLRIILGPDHRVLVPASILGGASFLALCDIIARALPVHTELPIGVITAMIGAPVFIFLLQRDRT